jgi:hypothetical protein
MSYTREDQGVTVHPPPRLLAQACGRCGFGTTACAPSKPILAGYGRKYANGAYADGRRKHRKMWSDGARAVAIFIAFASALPR